MPDKLTREYVVSISGDDNLTDTDINDFIKELEEWLTDQNTSAVDASDPHPSGPTDSSGVQSAG
jgi:hypothetical protein